MKYEQIEQPNISSFLEDFISEKKELTNFFHYFPTRSSFKKRAAYLSGHSINRPELVKVIRSYMEALPTSKKVERHLRELEENAFVVIGGQQAGLLTGPLYSIHKAISVILLAKQQRSELNQPVVPVFWIAGEDHDLDEINSTYSPLNGRLQKHTYNDRPNRKKMASETVLDAEKLQAFIHAIFKQSVETIHTRKLLEKVNKLASESESYGDFFAKLMHHFFAEEGLLLIDAAYGPLRKYESPYFVQMIEQSRDISKLVVKQEQLFSEAGYGEPIGASEDNANLFFVEDGERFLLKRKGEWFVNEQGNYRFTKSELITIAEKTPEKLSNNVVTRPLMQEMVFPVLAFIGGPGELAYWGTFKSFFEHMKMELPIIVPRLSITLVDRKSLKYMDELQLSIKDVFFGRLTEQKYAFIEDIQDSKAQQMIESIQASLKEQYEEISTYLLDSNYPLKQILAKNLSNHEKQFEFLQHKIEDTLLLRHEATLRKYNHIEGIIYPERSLQERIYSPIPFINEAGDSLIEDLLSMPFEFNGKHSIIYL
ncbi:MAG: bacillithiol biosynthesis cysteine-adding enzyme BshC [Paenisporosarcina sp.]